MLDHVSHIMKVFEICYKYDISLNLTKSVFCVDKDKLLGQIISKDGVKVDLERFEAIIKVPLMQNNKSL